MRAFLGQRQDLFFIHGKPDTPKESGMSLGGMGSFSPGESVLGKEHSSLLSAWPSAVTEAMPREELPEG